MYDPILNETFGLQNLEPIWWSQNGQEPVWITNQRQGGHSAVLDFPGMDVPFQGMLPEYEYIKYTESIPFNDRSDLAVALLANGSVNFVALYFSEPDKAGHSYGPFSKEMNEMLGICDKTLEYLLDRLEAEDILDKVNIILTADHGMTPVSINKTIYAMDYLNGTAYPYFTVENNPILGIWPNKSEHLDPLYEAMQKAEHVKVYKKEEIPEQYHYKNNVRVPPIVVVADEGWMVVGSRDFKTHYGGVKGMHGYNNSFLSMHPMFIVHGPAFKKGAVSKPFNSVDVYPLMCHLLGIKPRPNNGTLDTVKYLLSVHGTPPSNEEDGSDGRQHSQYFSVGIAFAVVIALLAIVLLTGMCLQQRSYRKEELTYHTLNDGLDTEDEEVFEDGDQMLPNTII
ncbi:hypothetical protein BSL78_29837 [Apostichopus japonicus]|uniref:AP3A hydrolase n=1 Tax=Stichopus japonicus TaxID=307972 RepID=A0A2G8JC73_STIJA|nr:hypothetical protein BSL78_29837 [Apostichopus japonicus]